MTSNLPERVEWVDAEIIDDDQRPVRRPVCWWRCGPCVRHPDKTAGQWGIEVQEVMGCLYLKDVSTKLAVEAMVEDWKVHCEDELLIYIDLLCFKPPALPQPVDWQRITFWNNRIHPGDNQDLWRWDFDGPEVFE